MIRVLLDTHVLLWSIFEPGKLSARARSVIEDIDNVRLVSAASAWEIATKLRLGKLEMARVLVESYPDHLATLQTTELPISSRHSLVAGQFQQVHRDPFDRILAAQALLEGVPLITADSAFAQFPISLLW